MCHASHSSKYWSETQMLLSVSATTKAPECYTALLLTDFLFALLAGRVDVLELAPGVKEAFFTRRDLAGICLVLTAAGAGAD